jgi:endonuclease YncB( thermonuclease family)
VLLLHPVVSCHVLSCHQVRESQGANTKQSPFYEELLKAQEAAQAGHKGLWTKVGGRVGAEPGREVKDSQ